MSNLTNQEVIEILNEWGPEAMRLGLITEKEVYQALGSSSDKGSYKNMKHGGMMNMDEMTRPLGYKFGTEDGTLVGDREKDLKEWEEDAIDRLRREMELEKYKKNILKNLPEIFDDPKTLEEFFKNLPGIEKEGKRKLPDWVEEFLEKRREDPDRFKNLIPKREDEGEPFRPEFGPDRFFWPPKGDPKYDPRYRPMPMPRFPDENWKGDPRSRPMPMPMPTWPPEGWKGDPRYDPRIGPYIIRPDDPPFDPEKDVQLLGDETSSGMHPIVVFKEMYDQYIMDGVPISGEQEPLSFKDFFEIIQIQLDNQASS